MPADPADIVFWLCAVLNVALAGGLILRFRSRVTAGVLTERRAKAIYSWLCLGIGLLCGIVIFLGITGLFDMSLGHGEAIIASPILNLLLSLVLIISGRIVIGWSPIKW
jgi:hypothetical protein